MDVPNAAPPEGEPQYIQERGMLANHVQVQQQLVMLLQAYECRIFGAHFNDVGRVCDLPHRSTFKEVLSHVAICQTGRNCPVPHCSSSRQIWGIELPKEWHQSITDDQRSNLVDLLLDTVSESQRSLMDVVCRDIEKTTYMSANTLSDYYRMLAAKKWQLEMELEDRPMQF